MYPIGVIINRLLCYHNYKKLPWLGIGPDFMQCSKCGKIAFFRDYLIDRHLDE